MSGGAVFSLPILGQFACHVPKSTLGEGWFRVGSDCAAPSFYVIIRGMAKTTRNEKAVVKADVAFYAQVRDVFVQARQFVHKTANFAMVKAYWLVGKMIVEKQGGEAKAAYGDRLIDELSMRLTQDLGAGFTRVNLFYMRRFFLAFQNVHTLCEQLSWSHYRLLISVENDSMPNTASPSPNKSSSNL